MYRHFYGLKERPFNVTADPSFFYLSAKHHIALSHLFYGVTQRKGIIVITGEIGTGKTTLCRYFLDQLDKKTRTALILNPYSCDIALGEAIMRDFGLKVKARPGLSFISEFNKFLLQEARHGRNVVIIIDEAQNLSVGQLEQVRLLSNLETHKDKLLQIVLLGQPELNDKLGLFELRQLQQRVMVRYHILPLNRADIAAYIKHRLRVSGGENKVVFSDEAMNNIAEFSKGIPRLINMICDRALLAAFVAETAVISGELLQKCADELGNYYAMDNFSKPRWP